MNPLLSTLQPYPFERLRQLFADIDPPAELAPVSLGIGEPRHATPAFIQKALADGLGGLSRYPSTAGEQRLREAFAGWLQRRYGVALEPATQVLPINGSREALFAFAQTVVDASRTPAPLVVCPNPFYQIYEGATLLAGATPYFAPSDPSRNFAVNWDSVPTAVWQRTQLVFVCSPGNPTGAVMPLSEWEKLFSLSDRYGFTIASDECYSEIYFRGEAPLGSLEAAATLGRSSFQRLVSFTSLSKRSNVPGLRSGFVAGDSELLKAFLLYRTYHGSAMGPAVQAASVAAWSDEEHVEANRTLYRKKFEQVLPLLEPVLNVALPDAGFYLWARIPDALGMSDTDFARALLAQYNVIVLPGSYLAREFAGANPGAQRIRMALVADTEECVMAAERIAQFVRCHSSRTSVPLSATISPISTLSPAP